MRTRVRTLVVAGLHVAAIGADVAQQLEPSEASVRVHEVRAFREGAFQRRHLIHDT